MTMPSGPGAEGWSRRPPSVTVAGSGLRFEDRGSHELKGVSGTWSVSRVAAADVAVGRGWTLRR